MSWHLSHDPLRAGLPLDRWPPQILQAWQDAKAKRYRPFRKDGGGARRSPATVLKSEKGLRRWLGFLFRLGVLEEEADPLGWLTPELLDQFFVHLRECGNADRSVVGRFQELQLAYKIMHPDRSFRWLTKPQGVPLEQLLPMRTRPLFVPGADDLLDWAEELYQDGIRKLDAQIRCAQVRDALMITILASSGPRLRALSSLQLGTHIFRQADGWWLDQEPDITKTGNALAFPLSPDASLMADRYVGQERPRMLQGQVSDAFWISWAGTPLAATSISGLLWRRTLERFGVGFGPHRFRAGLTTTLSLSSPSTPWDASTLLGHSPSTSLAHYNKAKATGASLRHNDRLKVMRDESEALAVAAFGTKLMKGKYTRRTPVSRRT